MASKKSSNDTVLPLSRGSVTQRKIATEWFASFDGPLTFEMRDLAISSHDGVAFAHSLHHVVGTKRSGEPVDMWFRSTTGLRKIDDRWQIVHEHISEPFDVQPSEALLDLGLDLEP
jgi:ketosteroid isomerase-like protein